MLFNVFVHTQGMASVPLLVFVKIIVVNKYNIHINANAFACRVNTQKKSTGRFIEMWQYELTFKPPVLF